MSELKNKSFPLILTLALVFSSLCYFYGDIILSPNKHLTSDNGDGIKAFFVYAGHIKNDTGYTNFENMNYPYGQTHVFTDGQTGIANLLKFLSRYNSFFLTHCMGIYNLLMLLSYVGCALFTFLILNRLTLPALFKIMGTLCITLLSPQVFRLLGHPTLSYVAFFPFCWWLLIKYQESEKKVAWLFIIIFNSSFWFFIHPYYVMLSGLFYFFFWLIYFFQNKKKRAPVNKDVIIGLLSAIIPIILTRFYVSWADTHIFRSQQPYGFWAYYANFNTVFMPSHPPLDQIFKFIFFWDKNQTWEGWAYVGFPAVCIAYYTLFKYFRYAFRKHASLILNPVLPNVLKTAMPAAILVLAFAMCYPFRIGFAFLLDWIPFLNQFRSLGRFAWCFYYVFTVYSVYTLWLFFSFLKQKKLVLLSYSIVIFLFGIFFMEGYVHHKEVAESANHSPNLFNYSQVNDDYREIIDKVNEIKNRYQCMISLPFYNVGNENFDTKLDDQSMRASMIISYWTDFPLMNNSAARSPILEGKKIMQFFSPSFFKKEIETDLPDKDPFLILYTRSYLNKQEQFLFDHSKKVLENNSFILAELPYDIVFKSNASEELSKFNQQKNSLRQVNGFLTDSTIDFVYGQNFDDHASTYTYRGSGGMKGIKRDYIILADKLQLHLKKDKEYTVSFWHYNHDELSNQVTTIIEEKDSNGNNFWDEIISPGESMVIDGNWSLVEKTFRPKNDDELISVFITGDRHSKQELFDDELLIRPAGKDVYKIISVDSSGNVTGIVKNNILIK